MQRSDFGVALKLQPKRAGRDLVDTRGKGNCVVRENFQD
jgi:hypothetical protein